MKIHHVVIISSTLPPLSSDPVWRGSVYTVPPTSHRRSSHPGIKIERRVWGGENAASVELSKYLVRGKGYEARDDAWMALQRPRWCGRGV